ncbi:MAG: hypothetical protein ACYDDQ_02095 [Vulcanimicrobiaceae bacterium]
MHSLITSRNREKVAFILTFGNGLNAGADEIFRKLTSRGIWYLSRGTKSLVLGSSLLFYQAQNGAVATGRLTSVETVNSEDRSILASIGLTYLSVRITYDRLEVFKTPVKIGPLVSKLGFIKNKTHWGLSFRTSPSRIPISDFKKIVTIGYSQKSVVPEIGHNS